MTTVGYGDVTPVTSGGRAIAAVVMLLGTGTISAFTAIIASIFVQNNMKADRGTNSLTLSQHIILCEWNHRTRDILEEFRADARTKDAPVVLIANLESKPIEDDEQFYFIRGDVNDETLRRACVEKASTAIVVGNDALNATARDAQVVLATLTIESLNPEVYTVVEIIDDGNARYCQRARADEIIVSSEFSSRLIARAALEHGMSKVVSELLSARDNGLCKLRQFDLLPDYAGMTFMDAFVRYKRDRNAIILAVKESDSAIYINPNPDFVLNENCRLIGISHDEEV